MKKDSGAFLVIRYSSLGDVILTTAVLRTLRNSYPDSRVDMLTKSCYSPVFEYNPDVACVFSSHPGLNVKYDAVLDLHDSLRSFFVRKSIKKRRLEIYRKLAIERRKLLYSGHASPLLEKSVVERYLMPLEKMGIDTFVSRPFLYTSEEEKAMARELSGEEKYIALVPGARWPTKTWLPEYYLELVIRIIRELKYRIVILGDDNDRELAAHIVSGAGLLKKYISNLTGETGLRTYIALIDGAELTVCPDSSAQHIAWALSSKAVVLYGPTVKAYGFQPGTEKIAVLEKDLKCRPCSLHGEKSCSFGDKACLRNIEVEDVFEKVTGLLLDSNACR